MKSRDYGHIGHASSCILMDIFYILCNVGQNKVCSTCTISQCLCAHFTSVTLPGAYNCSRTIVFVLIRIPVLCFFQELGQLVPGTVVPCVCVRYTHAHE